MATRQEILDGLVDAEVIADFPVTGERRRRTRVVDPVTKKIGWKEEVIQVTIPDQGTDPTAYDAWIVKHRAIYAEREEARTAKGREIAQQAIEAALDGELSALGLDPDQAKLIAKNTDMFNPAMLSTKATQAVDKINYAETKKAEVQTMDKAAVQAFSVASLVWP